MSCDAQDDLKAEALASGQAYLADPSYQEATQMSFADLFKKVRAGIEPERCPPS